MKAVSVGDPHEKLPAFRPHEGTCRCGVPGGNSQATETALRHGTPKASALCARGWGLDLALMPTSLSLFPHRAHPGSPDDVALRLAFIGDQMEVRWARTGRAVRR